MAAHRYWRLTGFSTKTGGPLDISEVRIYQNAVASAVAPTATLAPLTGSVANLSDGLSTVAASWPYSSYSQSGFSIVWDFTTAFDCTGLDVGSGASKATFPLGFMVQWSDGAGAWTTQEVITDLKFPGAFSFSNQMLNAKGAYVYGTDATKTPDQRYTDWATELAVSPTGTDYALDADDAAWPVVLAAAPISGKTTSASFASEGGLFIGYSGVAAASGTGIALPGVSRMQAVYDGAVLPAVGITFHTDTNLRSEGIKFRKAGKSTIIAGRVRQYGGMTYVNDFAIRLTGTSWEVYCSPTDQPVTIRVFDLLRSGYPLLANTTILAGAKGSLAFTSPEPGLSPTDPVPFYPAGSHALPFAFVGPALPNGSAGIHLKPILFFDAYNGGIGIVSGTVKEKNTPANTPLRRRVLLVDEASRLTIRETWSDAATGNYEFRGVKEGVKYTVLTYDHSGAYRAVVADNLTLANGGVELMP